MFFSKLDEKRRKRPYECLINGFLNGLEGISFEKDANESE
jgi:hypothetical protein